MLLAHICSGACYRCTEKAYGPDWKEKDEKELVKSTFHLVRALFQAKPGKPSEVIDCWECQTCHDLVPADSWHTYQATGNVIIRQPNQNKRYKKGR